jgi:hypothetical protein
MKVAPPPCFARSFDEAVAGGNVFANRSLERTVVTGYHPAEVNENLATITTRELSSIMLDE